jgi:cryptochrome
LFPRLDCQNDLSKSITKLNAKSKLFVLREAPQTVLPKLFIAWQPTHLVFEKDTDAYGRERDEVVVAAAKKAGVKVIIKSGRTLWDSDEIVAKNGGKPTMSFTQLQNAAKKIGIIMKPLPAPDRLPDPGELPVDFDQETPDTAHDFNAEQRTKPDATYSKIAGPEGDFAIETMEELGFASATTPHRGGETIALKMLDDIIADRKYTATFEKPKSSPAAFEPQSTTLLSPHLHFGALSVRLFFWRVQDVVSGYGKGASKPPESLTGQLFFRDMYFAAQAAIGPKFSQTVGNPYCRFVPWHLPSRLDPATGMSTGEYLVDSQRADIWFRRWKAGVTGFPWIDALMRQLREEGWIHHLGRHATACFLTRGGCYIDWERGAEVFEEWLIDHEPACNIGNWQWLSCTAFFSQYFRCYSPISFGQKWDKKGAFVRRWVPELKDIPAKYIYEPWKTPIPDQKKAGVRIQGDGLGDRQEGTYPKPMFDFNERREACMAAMKKAYDVKLQGNHPRVVSGTWRELFLQDGDGDVEMQGEMHSDDGGDADQGDESQTVEVDDVEEDEQQNEMATGKREAEKEGDREEQEAKKRKT